MSEQPKFDYGETVQITSNEHNGRIGAVVRIKVRNQTEPTPPSSGTAARLTLGMKFVEGQ